MSFKYAMSEIQQQSFTPAISEWLQKSLNKADFCFLTAVFQGKKIESQTQIYERIFRNLPLPPAKKDFTLQLKTYIEFLMKYWKQNHFLFCYFIRYLPSNQISIFLSEKLNISSFSEEDLNIIMQKLPKCDFILKLHCMRLQNEKTFLYSFTSLVNFCPISKEMKQFLIRCFRLSLQSGIGTDYSHKMLSILFATENYTFFFDIFFTSFLDSPSILFKYFPIQSFDTLFVGFPQRNDLPFSFLYFLVHTNTYYCLSDYLIIKYAVERRTVFLTFLFQILDEDELERIWRSLLKVITLTTSSNLYIHDNNNSYLNIIYSLSFSSRILFIHDILYSYRISIEHSISVGSICAENLFQDWILAFLSSSVEKAANSEEVLAVITIIFLLIRPNELLSSLVSSSINIYDYFVRILNKQSKSDTKFLNERIVPALLYILFPSYKYAFSDILVKSPSHSLLPMNVPPSNSFCKDIASSILTLLFEINDLISDDLLIQYLVTMSERIEFERVCHSLFNNESILVKISEKIDKSIYFKLITICLSHVCNFKVFYFIYSRICDDIQTTIHFFHEIALNAPIANSYFHLSENLRLKIPQKPTTVTLWFRMADKLNKNCDDSLSHMNSKSEHFSISIVSFVVSQCKYTLFFHKDTLLISNSNGTIGLINISSTIDNWCFLCILFDKKSIDIMVNLAEYQLTLNATSAPINLEIHPNIDFQSLQVFSNCLQRHQILHVFAEGPNSKDIVDNLIEIQSSSNLFSNDGYISTLYVNFCDAFNSCQNDYISNVDVPIDFSISPHNYTTVNVKEDDRWLFSSFFNSLDCIGGLDLIIHLVSEVFVKYFDFQKETLDLVSILLNRFPFVHYYFVDNSVYDLLSCLVDSHLNFQSLFLYHNKLITNSKIIQCFLLKSQQSRSLVQNLVKSFGESGNHNYKFLNATEMFNMIIVTITEIENEQIIEPLINFAFKLTDQSNLVEHASFVFNYLLSHVFDLEKKISETSAIYLLDSFFDQLVICTNFRFDSFIPFLLASTVSSNLKLCLLKHLISNIQTHSYNFLSFAIQNINIGIEQMFSFAKSLPYSKATLIFPYFMNRIDNPLALNYLEQLCDTFKVNTNDCSNEILRQYLLLFQCHSAPHFFLTKDERNISHLMKYVTVLIIFLLNHCIDIENSRQFESIILFFFNIQSLRIFDKSLEQEFGENIHISMTFSLLASVLLIFYIDPSTTKSKDLEVWISFLISFSQFLFSQILVTNDYSNFCVVQLLNLITFICEIDNTQKMGQNLYKIDQNTKESILSKTLIFISYLKSQQTFTFDEQIWTLFGLFEQFIAKKTRLHSTFTKRSSSNINHSKTTFVFLKNQYIHSSVPMLPNPLLSIKHFNQETESSSIQSNEINSNNTQPTTKDSNDVQLTKELNNIQLDSSETKKSNVIRSIIKEPHNTKPECEIKLSNEVTFNNLPLVNDQIANNVDLINENNVSFEKRDCIQNERNVNNFSRFFLTNNDSFSNKWNVFCDFCYQFRLSKLKEIDSILEKDSVDINTIINSWKKVFYSLQIPSSHIYTKCPTKYKINESSTKVEIRRLLFPINPSFDPCYLKDWPTKYRSNPPTIRLHLNEVVKPNLYSIKHGQLLFLSKAIRLFGILFIKGYIIITNECLIFHNKESNDLISFFFEDIRSIRLSSHEHQKKGILVEDVFYQSYSFAFKDEASCDKFVKIMNNYVEIVLEFDREDLLKKQEKWRLNKISNFDYLMYLNKISGQTWSDFTKYPMLPWVLTKYPSDIHERQIELLIQNQNETSIPNSNHDTVNSTVENETSTISNDLTEVHNESNMGNETDDLTETSVNSNCLNENEVSNDINESHSGQQEKSVTFHLNIESIKLNYKDKSIFRDLAYPLFAQTDDQRQQCKKYYEMSKELEDSSFKAYFPNYLSNVGSAIYYLVRVEPITTEELLFQGGDFDSSDRMFQSFDITSQIMIGMHTKSSLEFVPEIYYLPETYKNVNNLIFTKKNSSCNYFVLPDWSKSPEDLVYKLRKALESPLVSLELNEWIDLIWGFRREGQFAGERYNILPEIIFKFNPEAAGENKLIKRALKHQIHNCGAAPQQLFFEPHPHREVPINDNALTSPKRGTINKFASSSMTKIEPMKSGLESGFFQRKASFDVQDVDLNANVDINRYTFFCQRNSRMRFERVRPRSSLEQHSLQFDRDLILDRIHRIGLMPSGKLKLSRIHSKFPPKVIQFSSSIEPILIAKSAYNVVTAHKTPLIIHWKLVFEPMPNGSFVNSSSNSTFANSGSNLITNSSAASKISVNEHIPLVNSPLPSSKRPLSSTPPSIQSHRSISGTSPSLSNVESSNLYNRESRLTMVKVLRGHPINITSIYISVTSFLILSGHEDGHVSVFSISPHQFLRVIDTSLNYAVTLLRTTIWNSDILIFQESQNGDGLQSCLVEPTDYPIQNEDSSLMKKLFVKKGSSPLEKTLNHNNIGFEKEKKLTATNHKCYTILSLYSVNGSLLHRRTFSHKVFDCCTTSFNFTTKKNYFIILTNDPMIILINSKNLEVVQCYDISQLPSIVSMTYNSKTESLILTTKTKDIIEFKVEAVDS